MAYDREIHFKINGRDWTDDRLLVSIPSRYADLFEGVNFPSKDLFSRALMFANCAEEAIYYKMDWVYEQDERDLKSLLAKFEKSSPADRQSDRRLVLVSVPQSSSDCGWLIQEQGSDQGCGSDRG